MKKIAPVIIGFLYSIISAAQPDSLRTKIVNVSVFNKKKQWGIMLGIGTSQFKPTYSNWEQGNVNYNDSLQRIKPSNIFKFDLGILCRVYISKLLSIQPLVQLRLDGGKLIYDKQPQKEKIDASTVSSTFSLPIIFKYRIQQLQPYFSAGPTLLYMLGQEKDEEIRFPLKKFDVLGEIGAGIDFHSKQAKAIFSPAISYSVGFLNNKGSTNNLYNNTIKNLTRRSFTVTISIRQE